MHKRSFVFLLFLGLSVSIVLSSCGGGGGSGGSSLAVASIEVSPGSVLLSEVGQSLTLSAHAYDADGVAMATAFTWESTNPALVAVNDSGVVTRQAGAGSATITAIAGGTTSNSVFAFAATPAAGALLVSDAQVTGDIAISDTSVPWGLGSHYTVELTDIAPPSPGDILVSTGEEPIGGRVVSAIETGNTVVVVLEVVGLEDLFDELVISEELDLSNEPYLIDDFLADSYDITEFPDGTVLFTRTPPATPRRTSFQRSRARGTSVLNPDANFGPFTCTSTMGYNPLQLNNSPASISVNTGALSAIIEYDSTNPSSQRRLGITGGVQATFKTELTLTAAYEGKVSCKYNVLEIPLPPLGALAPFFGGWVPLGIGFEAGGKFELGQTGFTFENKATGTFEGGLQWYSSGDWSLFGTANLEPAEPKFEFITPTLGADHVTLYSNMKLKPEMMLFGSADFELGLRGGRLIRYIFGGPTRAQLLSAKLGPKLGGDLAIVEGQIDDAGYKSGYKLELEATLGPGESITNLLNFFGLVNATSDLLKFTMPFVTSPAATDVEVDAGSYEAGDTLEFSVTLDAASTTVPILGYNVEEVLIYRKADPAAINQTAELMGGQNATDGQTGFSILWTADDDGTVGDDFFAFVVTKFLPFPYFGSLELGPVGVSSALKILAAVAGDEYPSSPAYLTRTEVMAYPASGSGGAQSAAGPEGGLPLLVIDPAACTYAGGLEILPGQSQSFGSHATHEGLADAASGLQVALSSNAQEARLAFDLRAWGHDATLQRGGPWVDESGTANARGGPAWAEGGMLYLVVANEGILPEDLEIAWEFTGTLANTQPTNGSSIFSQAHVSGSLGGVRDLCGAETLFPDGFAGETSLLLEWGWATLTPLSDSRTISGTHTAAVPPGLYFIGIAPGLGASAAPGLDWDGPDVHEVTATVTGTMVFRAMP